MSDEESRMHILQMIDDGKISPDEGLRLLKAINGQSAAPPAGGEADPAAATEPDGSSQPYGPAATGEVAQPHKPAAEPDPQLRYWRRWWMIPMFVGVGVTLVAALLMYWAVQLTGFGAYALFACAWLPMAAGLGAIALAWASRNSRWVHVRVDRGADERPRRISISLPIPVRVVAWALRTFGQKLPAMKQTSVDELLLALDDSATPETPIFIDVDQGEKGERVQVYIG